MAFALALFPVSMQQLMDIADTGNIMPPKTTWFEPKLRSGLVIHSSTTEILPQTAGTASVVCNI